MRVIHFSLGVDLEKKSDRAAQELDALGSVVQTALKVGQRALKGFVDFFLVQPADFGRRGDLARRVFVRLCRWGGGSCCGLAAAAGWATGDRRRQTRDSEQRSQTERRGHGPRTSSAKLLAEQRPSR